MWHQHHMGADWRGTYVILVYKPQRKGRSFSSTSKPENKSLPLLSALLCSAHPPPLHCFNSSCTLFHSSLSLNHLLCPLTLPSRIYLKGQSVFVCEIFQWLCLHAHQHATVIVNMTMFRLLYGSCKQFGYSVTGLNLNVTCGKTRKYSCQSSFI